jgi:bacterioferritin-associated ferredoxin
MPSKIEILKKIIEDKHGKLIGGTYVDSTSSITVKCDKGHTWNTKVKSIMIGNWCHTCAKIRDNESRKKISTTLIEYNKTDEGKQKKIESHAKRSATMKKERDEIIATQTDKKCGKCKNTKPNSAFNKKSDAKDKFQSQCKDCMNEVRRLIREKNKERVKNEGLRFECKICLSTFQLKDSLTRHIKNKHS